MTVKPPMTFFVFILLAIHIKTRGMRYCRHGKTHEEYEAFLKTNRNAWNFSVYAAVTLFIAGVIDLIFLFVFLVGEAGSEEQLEVMANSVQMLKQSIAASMGFGEASITLMVIAPIVLLFNYTKIPKNKTISTLIPVAGILLIVIIGIQGIYQLVSIAPIPKVDGKALGAELTTIFSLLAGE